MDKNYENNSKYDTEKIEETWENIRLQENMVDNSFNFKAKKYK